MPDFDRRRLCRRLLALAAGPLLPGPARARSGATEAPLLLAETYHGHEDPAAYWVSEKLDGVRAWWDGQTLFFRSGRPIAAPAWFLAGLPQRAVDGELWLGRGRFDALSAIVRRQQPVDTEWRQVRYLLFELPGAPGTFSERLVQLQSLAAAGDHPGWEVLEQFRVADRGALQQRLAAILAAGGEGLMLHRADAPYRSGRDPALLKVKAWLDGEARVIGHEPGRGRHAGRLGALRVETADGRRFRLGSGLSDADRAHPPAIGSTVTYRYRELNRNGLPRFATYWRPAEAF